MRGSRAIERDGKKLIWPLLEQWAGLTGHVLDTDHALRPKPFQKLLGDAIVVRPTRRWFTVEFKVETTYSRNCFAEWYSDLRPEEGVTKPGWLQTCEADVLLWVFLDKRVCYEQSLPGLRAWASGAGRLTKRYEDKVCGRYLRGEQENRTVGYLVPWLDLQRENGAVMWLMDDGRWRKCERKDC
jgi:hypothetical protein